MDFSTLRKKIDLIVIGCSVGGIEALKRILEDLPPTFSLPIAIVQHRSPDSNAMLIRYFSEICKVKIAEPNDKEPIMAGHAYFAPANYHLLIAQDKRFNLSVDEAVHYSRPSIDVLFKTAADVYGPRLLGIVLSGANADGSTGLLQIKQRGGITVVQDPSDAFQREMPAAAMAAVNPDFILPLSEIKELIHGF